MKKGSIGVFDSGVGGLWILKHLQEELPGYNYVFFGDQGHVPYGGRTMEEIRLFSEGITKFLISKGCNVIVIACNTASATSLKYLREKFPKVIFVGMEPAIKPAVEVTHTRKVGVLATPATFQGELYNSVVERFAYNVEIFKDTCSGLVGQIEKGDLNSIETRSILERGLLPMLKKNIDTVVLGCTHYPFVIPLIKKIVGDKVNVIDPTSAIVHQVSRVLSENKLLNKFVVGDRKIDIFTSGEKDDIKPILSKLFDKNIEVNKIDWNNNFELNMLK
ncbi:MAG: glutamate racemase [Candidatus Paceibacterota bacterium]